MPKPTGERVEIIGTIIFSKSLSTGSSQMAQLVKNLSVMPETPVRSLGWEDPLERGVATHPLPFLPSWTEEPGGLQFKGLQRVRHD